MKRFIRVADDFYPDPEAVRKRALAMTYTEPENLVGVTGGSISRSTFL